MQKMCLASDAWPRNTKAWALLQKAHWSMWDPDRGGGYLYIHSRGQPFQHHFHFLARNRLGVKRPHQSVKFQYTPLFLVNLTTLTALLQTIGFFYPLRPSHLAPSAPLSSSESTIVIASLLPSYAVELRCPADFVPGVAMPETFPWPQPPAGARVPRLIRGEVWLRYSGGQLVAVLGLLPGSGKLVCCSPFLCSPREYSVHDAVRVSPRQGGLLLLMG